MPHWRVPAEIVVWAAPIRPRESNGRPCRYRLVAAEVRVPALRPKGGNGPRRIRLGDLLTDKFTVSSNGHHPMWARQEPG